MRMTQPHENRCSRSGQL